MKGHHQIEEPETLHLHEHSCDFDVGHPHTMGAQPAPLLSFLGSGDLKRLSGSIVLTALVMLIEAVGGVVSNSLALLSDAGHMLTHLLALFISLLALIFSTRPPTSKKTFGFYRLEILAALLNSLLLLLVTLWIFYQAYQRFYFPQPVASTEMFVIGLVGLATNLITAFLLSGATRKGLNLQSAFLHMIGDTLSSLGVVAAAGVIYFTQWWFLDPLLGVLLSIVILFWAFKLMMESINILLEAAPKEIDPAQVVEAVMVIKEVRDVHDVHVWTLTSGMYALSAHVVAKDMSLKESGRLLKTINSLLCQRFKIGHAAIQFEIENAPSPSAK